MNPKKFGVSEETPSQTVTWSDNRNNRHNCQGAAEEPLLFTLPNDQIRDVKAPGAIIAGSVRPLPLQIGHSDHKCQQAWRDETHAVYKHSGSHGQFIGWEVILIKVAPAARIFGKDYPEREVYPSNEDFGRYALSVGAQHDLEYAIGKAKSLKVKNGEKQGAGRLLFQQMSPGEPAKPTGTVTERRTGTGTNTNRNRNTN
jgi:hypothetical protein